MGINGYRLDMDKLRAGIIGIGGYGGQVLAELGRNDCFDIKAIGDKDIELAKVAGQKYEAHTYDDYRSFIVQEELDVLFLMLPNYLCNEYIQEAAKKRFHVFKAAPLARSLVEADGWVEQMKRVDREFIVCSTKRFASGFAQAHELIVEQKIGTIYLVRGECLFNYDKPFEWRGDAVLAGGGALLEAGWDLVDLITWSVGVPEQVYSLNSNMCRKRVVPPYQTEDTAIVMMKFANGASGNLVCSWTSEPTTERLIFHGTQGSIEAGTDYVRVFDVKGELLLQEDFQVNVTDMIAGQLTRFYEYLNSADDDVKAGDNENGDIEQVGTAKQHLVNMAIIDAAYLSAKTQLPETVKVYTK